PLKELTNHELYLRYKDTFRKNNERLYKRNGKEYKRKWIKENPEKHKGYVKDYETKNKGIKNVWNKAEQSIKLEGQICEICKEKKAEVRHHEDYSKPREVILVCMKCHKKIHKRLDKERIELEQGGSEDVCECEHKRNYHAYVPNNKNPKHYACRKRYCKCKKFKQKEVKK
ncbi:unnamed protein product, partial [marine sediment metagenome]